MRRYSRSRPSYAYTLLKQLERAGYDWYRLSDIEFIIRKNDMQRLKELQLLVAESLSSKGV